MDVWIISELHVKGKSLRIFMVDIETYLYYFGV